jgi:Carboxypeptidase regulatory-like domain
MRRLSWAVALLVAAASWAPAGARAAAAGTIRGRVLNGSARRPQPGVEVTLSAGRSGRRPVARRTTTDRRGRFEFSGLATGGDLAYALDARFDGGLFAGGAVQLPSSGSSAPVIDTTLRVWPTTTDPSAIVVARDLLFVVPHDSRAGAIESVTVANTSPRAYIGRGGRLSSRREPAPTLAFALPAGASLAGLRILQASLDVPTVLPDRDLGGFTTTVAIPPGKSEIVFAYPLALDGGRIDLSRRALYPVLDLRVFAAEPLSVRGDLLEAAGDVTLQGRTYRRWSARGDLDPGDVVQATAVAEAGRDPLLIEVGAALLLIALAGGLVARRRLRREAPGRPPDRSRTELLEAIAELDLRREAGELSEGRWERERTALKGVLERLGPEPS